MAKAKLYYIFQLGTNNYGEPFYELCRSSREKPARRKGFKVIQRSSYASAMAWEEKENDRIATKYWQDMLKEDER